MPAMSSDSGSQYSEDNKSRSRPQSRTPHSPRKRRRIGSVDPSRSRRYSLEGKYNDAYRLLYNDDVHRAATRFVANDHWQHYTTQVGASTWTPREQAVFFAALERLGQDHVPAIAEAIGTKTLPETQELLLLLQDAAAKHGDAKVTLRDIPAAMEVGTKCNDQLDLAGEALAWYQEAFEASQEQDRFGDYWLITPEIANHINHAVADPPPSDSPPPPLGEPEGPRTSCVSCKQFKQKCDRETPCGNCLRRNIAPCVYSQKLAKPGTHTHARTKSRFGDEDDEDDIKHPNILQVIPEAALLDVATMLTLSKTLFMNRSHTIPSPWLHWSEYKSEFADEPSIYRSAFTDLHTLAVSVTRRLVQTAIMQATSRLRSQRRRARKGILPLVKRRDVLAAITTAGLKYNGRDRWRGVARRCSVRVYEGRHDYDQHGKYKREIPWDQVEQIMSCIEPSSEFVTTDAETSDQGARAFAARAARSGTPLPMDQLALSDSEEELDDLEAYSDDLPTAKTNQSTIRPKSLHRDPLGRYTSVPLQTSPGSQDSHLYTIEQFDQEASRQEEQALRHLLDFDPPAKDQEARLSREREEADVEFDEKVVTGDDNWRQWTEYRAEWEEFRNPTPAARFCANQKLRGVLPVPLTTSLRTAAADSGDDTDTLATEGTHRINQRASRGIELRARGTRAYAALQEKAFIPNTQGLLSSSNGSEGDDADVPTQSIEVGGQLPDSAASEDEMSWEA
ncbi:hypothetical protein BKA66DRAFT_224637 [Pyrenochaeta sp. MPI-SDFR-AT-0127]|nr:hypothetical protein BKA66DRAFT_224637 [Pyrenochaeta sp. MPI-SDFR-AT-0127]